MVLIMVLVLVLSMKMRQVLVFTRFAAAVLVLRDVLNTLGGGPSERDGVQGGHPGHAHASECTPLACFRLCSGRKSGRSSANRAGRGPMGGTSRHPHPEFDATGRGAPGGKTCKIERDASALPPCGGP